MSADEKKRILCPAPLASDHRIGGILRTSRKTVKFISTCSAHTAPARQRGGAEKTLCRGFLDCGLFLILEAFRADTTSNRGIGKKSAATEMDFPRRHGVFVQAESPLKPCKGTVPRQDALCGPRSVQTVRFSGGRGSPRCPRTQLGTIKKSCLRSACHEKSFYHWPGRENM